MAELKTAVMYVVIIIATAVAMALGDYLGYKIKRTRLVAFLGCVVLLTIIGFTIYAAILTIRA